MPGILSPIIGGLRRWATTTKSGRRPTTPPADDRNVVLQLTKAIDQAMAMGMWDHADRLARTAARLAPRHARISERLARLRLAQGDPETALGIIDACPTGQSPGTASLRLLRVACLLHLGAKAEAHSDLLPWSAQASAPLDARVLLGLLEWQRGDDTAAVQALLRNLKHLEDPRTLQALLLINVQRGRQDQTEMWAQRLRTCCATVGAEPDVDVFLKSLGMAGARQGIEPSPEQVNALAMELITFEAAIGTLTEAQRRRPHLPTIGLLGKALEQALPDLGEPAAALHALASLSILLGDHVAARRWALRGLEENPMSVPLALLLGELPAPTPQTTADDSGSVIATIGRKAGTAELPAEQEKAA